jgi:hypothetical protein
MPTIGLALKEAIDRYAGNVPRDNVLFVAARCGDLRPRHVRAYASGILFLIRGTMDVLRRAERRARAIGDDALASYYGQKVREEQGHDRWAERDLSNLDASDAERGPQASARGLARLVAYLDEVVEREPALFLAYIFLAEYLTVLVGDEWLRLVEQSCAIPQTSLTVVANHVELDREHTAVGLREIDTLVGAEKLDGMLAVLRESITCYEEFWSDVLATTSQAA